MIEIKTIKYVTSLDNFSDVIIQLEWEYSIEGFYSIGGTLELPMPTSDTFIPIEELDKDIMIGWVRDFINPEEKELQPIQVEIIINTITFN